MELDNQAESTTEIVKVILARLLTKPTTQADIVGGYWNNDDDEEYF